MPKLEKFLFSVKKKTITAEEIRKELNCYIDKDIYEEIRICIEKGLISPVKNSRTNGSKSYTIYDKYHITASGINELTNEEWAEIDSLYPLLKKNDYFINNVFIYRKYREIINRISKYLFELKEDKTFISKKERSFMIFGEEKILDDSNLIRILAKLDITEERLGFYNTPEYYFCDYIPENNDGMVLLVCENKDIWYDIRKIMFEKKKRVIFGRRIDGVILGDGNKITGKDAFSEYIKFMNVRNVTFLYWGDIDKAGFDIYQRFKMANPKLNIQLFEQGYNHMIELASDKEIPDSNDNRDLNDNYRNAIMEFTLDISAPILEYVEGGKRLPQEIVNYVYLNDHMR